MKTWIIITIVIIMILGIILTILFCTENGDQIIGAMIKQGEIMHLRSK